MSPIDDADKTAVGDDGKMTNAAVGQKAHHVFHEILGRRGDYPGGHHVLNRKRVEHVSARGADV